MINMKMDECLAKNRFDSDDRHPHIIIDPQQCLTCVHKACTRCCPAERYQWDEAQQQLKFDHVGCLECGNCRFVCERLNQGVPGYSWNYPEQGKGIIFRRG
ncbi:4Fe-4S ferredoxin [Sporolactobacillus sp. CQH2019]|uniref:ferredoxin family protein n=1 Tax=Sporolactobacillus sp. CQH2019 TaxID=3023512 RepID=UPI002367CFEB|nr:4Fe-4S ferredoxin [Sporolactobacillus sp. CQH2019]MDD9146937.1 4Fe-4S ferredoxin [Sporolactobacillus sp. CQH2019]